MKKVTFATIAGAVLTVSSIGLAAPAIAEGWDFTPVAPGYGNSSSSAGGGTDVSGAPADYLPPASPGANPGVPLGPGH